MAGERRAEKHVSEEQGKAPHTIWRPLGAPALIGDPIVQCLILIVVTSAIFLAFPGIDIWFSNLFYRNGFIAGQLEAFIALRDFWRNMTAVIAIVLVAVLIIKLVWPYRQSLLRPRDIVFILSTLIVGPGIVTNLIFKDNWGRPRPYQVVNYGGSDPFVGVWQITHYCSHNCSFVSGEGSSSMWLLTLAVLLPERWRPTGIKVLLALPGRCSRSTAFCSARISSPTWFSPGGSRCWSSPSPTGCSMSARRRRSPMSAWRRG